MCLCPYGILKNLRQNRYVHAYVLKFNYANVSLAINSDDVGNTGLVSALHLAMQGEYGAQDTRILEHELFKFFFVRKRNELTRLISSRLLLPK